MLKLLIILVCFSILFCQIYLVNCFDFLDASYCVEDLALNNELEASYDSREVLKWQLNDSDTQRIFESLKISSDDDSFTAHHVPVDSEVYENWTQEIYGSCPLFHTTLSALSAQISISYPHDLALDVNQKRLDDLSTAAAFKYSDDKIMQCAYVASVLSSEYSQTVPFVFNSNDMRCTMLDFRILLKNSKSKCDEDLKYCVTLERDTNSPFILGHPNLSENWKIKCPWQYFNLVGLGMIVDDQCVPLPIVEVKQATRASCINNLLGYGGDALFVSFKDYRCVLYRSTPTCFYVLNDGEVYTYLSDTSTDGLHIPDFLSALCPQNKGPPCIKAPCPENSTCIHKEGWPKGGLCICDRDRQYDVIERTCKLKFTEEVQGNLKKDASVPVSVFGESNILKEDTTTTTESTTTTTESATTTTESATTTTESATTTTKSTTITTEPTTTTTKKATNKIEISTTPTKKIQEIKQSQSNELNPIFAVGLIIPPVVLICILVHVCHKKFTA